MSRGSEPQYFEPNVLSISDAASAEAAMSKLLEDANTSLKDASALTVNQGTWPASQLESSGALPSITLTFDVGDSEGDAGGNSEGNPDLAPIPEHLSDSALFSAAGDIRSALNFESILGHFGKVDSDRIINILDSMSLVDRQNLETQYLLRYRTNLREDLEWRLWPEPYARSVAVLDRIDGVTNDVGQIDVALTLLGSDQKRGELTLIQSLMVLNSQQIADLNGEYLARHGKGLFDTILGENQLSESAKQVVRILLNGTDNNIDPSTGKWTLPAFEQLSELALESADIDFFELVFSSASDQAREQFSATGGGDKIFTAFMRNFDDLKLAIELAGAGEIRLSTIIRGNTHFLHTDRDSIELALRHSSPADRELYSKGRELHESGASPASGPDADALTFYRDLHDAISYSSGGTDWEIIKFEDILLRGGSLIEKVMDLEEPNLLGIGGTHHVTEAVMSQLENMSSEDWQRLRSDTRFEQDLRAALKSTLDDHEESIAFSMLDAKKSAASFDESRLAGRRSVIEVINENSWGGVLYRYEPGIIIDRILSMSASELANYRNGLPASRTDLLSVIDDKLAREPEHSLALRLLAQAEQVSAVVPTEQVAQANEGIGRLQLSPADQVIYDRITKAPPQVLFRHLEQGFSGPALRERFQNPQNEDARKMRQSLYAAAEYALSEAKISTRNARQPYFDAFFSSGADGNLPINLEMALCKTDADRLAVLRNCTENERTLLLTEGTSNEEAVALQRSVLDPLNEDLRELFWAVLTNGFVSDRSGTTTLAFRPEDQVRAFVLNAGADPIHDLFENLTNDQVVNIKNAYAEKFGSDLSGDVLKSVDEKKRFAYANLLETVSSAARQDFYDLQVEFSEHMNGLAPDMMRSFGWNASQEDALRQSDLFRNALMEYSSNFQDLPPERQDALAYNFAEAIENFRKSKEEFSDVAVDAAIMAVGFLLAAVTAGQSINIALLLKAAALGATMKVAGGKIMQGYDYDSTEIAGDAFMGAVMMAGNVIGPAAVAKGLGIGRNAVRTAVSELDVFFKQAHIVERLAQSGLTFEPAAMQKGLEQIYRTILLTGKKVDEKAYYSIIERALTPAGDVALPAGMADLARRNFVEGFAKGLADDFFQTSLAGRTPFQNFRLHLGLSELTAIPVGAVASGGSRLLAWDGRKSFDENIQDALVSAGFGAAFGAGLSLAFTAGAHTLGYLVRNGKNYFFHNSSSESRSITTIEGTKKDLPPGQWLEISPTDTIDLPADVDIRAIAAPEVPALTIPGKTGDMIVAPPIRPAIPVPGAPFADLGFPVLNANANLPVPAVADFRIGAALAQSGALDRPMGADVAYNIRDTKSGGIVPDGDGLPTSSGRETLESFPPVDVSAVQQFFGIAKSDKLSLICQEWNTLLGGNQPTPALLEESARKLVAFIGKTMEWPELALEFADLAGQGNVGNGLVRLNRDLLKSPDAVFRNIMHEVGHMEQHILAIYRFADLHGAENIGTIIEQAAERMNEKFTPAWVERVLANRNGRVLDTDEQAFVDAFIKSGKERVTVGINDLVYDDCYRQLDELLMVKNDADLVDQFRRRDMLRLLSLFGAGLDDELSMNSLTEVWRIQGELDSKAIDTKAAAAQYRKLIMDTQNGLTVFYFESHASYENKLHERQARIISLLAMQGMSGKSPSGLGNANELLDNGLGTALQSPEPSNVVVRPFGQYIDGSYNWTSLERYSTAELERMLEVLRPGYPAVSTESLDQFVEVMYEALNGNGSSATLRKLMPKDLRGKMTALENERALERVQEALDTFCEEHGLPYMLVNLAALDPNVRAAYSNGYIFLNDNLRLADNMPESMNNIGHELSHGQQSYVQIARAIQILEENGITSEQEQNLVLKAAPFGFHSESMVAEVREMVEAGELSPDAYALGDQLLKVRALEFDRGFGPYSSDDPEGGALRLILQRLIADMQLTTDDYLPEEIARRFLRTTGYILPDSLLLREYNGKQLELTDREIELSELLIDSYESNQGNAGRAMAAKRLSISIGETIAALEKGDIQPDVLIETSDLFFPAIGSTRFDGEWATLWDSVQNAYSAAAGAPSLLAARNNDETRAHLLRILNERRQQLELYHERAITNYMASAVETVPYLLSEILQRKAVQYAEQHKLPAQGDRWRSSLNPRGQSVPQDLPTETQPQLISSMTPTLQEQVFQSKITEAMLSDSEVIDVVEPDWFSSGFVRRYEGKIRYEDQLHNVHIRVFDEQGGSSSQRFLRESISKSISTHLFNTVPATVRRTIPINGTDTNVWIQDGAGRTFGPGLAISEVYNRPIWAEEEFLDMFRTDSRLSQAWERAVVERSILGSLDAHSANFTLIDQANTVPEGERLLVGNIDLPDTLGTRQVPVWRLADFRDINNTLFQEMTGKPLHPDTVHGVALFIALFDSPAGRQFLNAQGMSNDQIEALLNRAKWFSSNQRFPDIE